MPAATKKAASPKKARAKKAAASKPWHPRLPSYQAMVLEAIKELKERKGATRQAMKKYIIATYHGDLQVVSATHFNSALTKLTENGTLEKSENGQRWKNKRLLLSRSQPPRNQLRRNRCQEGCQNASKQSRQEGS